MPTYEYVCSKCGSQFDYFQSISSEPLKECPLEAGEAQATCGGEVTRLISGGAGLIFRGSGFYITDYRSDDYKAAQKKETEGSSSSTDGKSSDSKGNGSSSTSNSSGSKEGSSGSNTSQSSSTASSSKE